MKYFENLRKQKKHPLPYVTLPYNQEIKKIQNRWFFSFLIIFGFAIFYTYQYSQFQVEQNTLIDVVTAKKELVSPMILSESDLMIQEFSKKNIPESYFSKKEDLIGKPLVQNVISKQIILLNDININSNPDSISSKFTELFAFSIDESWMASRLPEIKKNDKIDVVISNPKKEITETITVAQQVKVIDIQVGKDKKKTLIVNITKDEASAILFSHGLRLPMQVLVYPTLTNKKLTNE